jgi:hypothetical protein
MSLIQPTYAIYQQNSYGPIFGNGDIRISDKSNQNEISGVYFPWSYNNGQY